MNIQLIKDALKSRDYPTALDLTAQLLEDEKFINAEELSNLVDDENNNLLMLAIKLNKEKLALQFMDLNIDVNKQNLAGETPLFHAINIQNIKLVQALLEKDVEIKPDGRKSLLKFAFKKESTPIKKAMLLKFIDSNPTKIDTLKINNRHIIFWAIENNCIEIVEKIVNGGDHATIRNIKGILPLNIAVRMGNIDIVKLLLHFEDNINRKDLDGKTALHWACELNQLEIAKVLLEAHASCEIVDNNGNIPLLSALASCVDNYNVKTLELITLLLVKTKNITRANQNSWSILDIIQNEDSYGNKYYGQNDSDTLNLLILSNVWRVLFDLNLEDSKLYEVLSGINYSIVAHDPLSALDYISTITDIPVIKLYTMFDEFENPRADLMAYSHL